MDTLRLFSLWHSDITNKELAQALGVGRSTLSAIRHRHKLPPRPKDTATAQVFRQAAPDPTEAEIAEMCAAFRAAWSSEEWEQRYVGPKGSGEWTPPAFRFNRVEYAFTAE